MNQKETEESIAQAVKWALKQDEELNVITGENSDLTADQMEVFFRYTSWQAQMILFMREIIKMQTNSGIVNKSAPFVVEE